MKRDPPPRKAIGRCAGGGVFFSPNPVRYPNSDAVDTSGRLRRLRLVRVWNVHNMNPKPNAKEKYNIFFPVANRAE